MRWSHKMGSGYVSRSVRARLIGFVIVSRAWLSPEAGATQNLIDASGGRDTGITREELIPTVRAATEAIETVQGTYRTYFQSKSMNRVGKPVSGVREGPNGLWLYSEFDLKWRSDLGLERIDGKWGYVQEGQFAFVPVTFAYDGEKLRSITWEAKSGKEGGLDNTFWNWRKPLVLMGRGIAFSPLRDLGELLHGAELISVPNTPTDLKTLRSRFTEGERLFELTAWIDISHGFLPRRMEIHDTHRSAIERLYISDEIREMSPGIWLTIRGSETFYYQEAVRSEGPSAEKGGKLSKDKLRAVSSDVKYISKPLGYGTQTYEFETKNLRINEPIARDEFTLTFPPGAIVFDTVTLTSRRIPDPTKPNRSVRGGALSQPSSCSIWYSSRRAACGYGCAGEP